MIPYVDGIEISSIKEFDILKRMKFDITRISYGIPIKSREEIEYLGMHGCKVFVADSICELMKIRKSCPTSTILLRLNVSKYIGKCIEYGIDFEMLKDSVLPEYDGFIFHISNCNLSDHLSILDKVEDILKKSAFRKKMIINIGGSYRCDDMTFFNGLNERLLYLSRHYNIKLRMEPGAAIVYSAGTLRTSVLRKDVISSKSYDIFIDAGRAEGVYCMPMEIRNLSRCIEEKVKIYRFIDNSGVRNVLFICKSYYPIEEGDLLEFANYGAYSLCYINRFHNKYEPQIYYSE